MKDLQDSVLYERYYQFKEKRASYRFFIVLLLIVATFFGVRRYWVNHYGGVQVDGSSMKQTLISGQQLIMEYTPEGKGAKRGDIIVVEVDGYEEVQKENASLPEESRLRFVIKRLIAIEGDAVRCIDGQVEIKYAGSIEYVPLDEPYAYYPTLLAKAGYDFEEYVVGEGEIFFLGDNRTNSKDSRYKQENGSHLKGRLYKAADIIGVVPNWALEYQSVLEKIFF